MGYTDEDLVRKINEHWQDEENAAPQSLIDQALNRGLIKQALREDWVDPECPSYIFTPEGNKYVR